MQSLSPRNKAGALTDISPLLDRRVEESTSGLPSSLTRRLLFTGKDNIETIVRYIAAIKSEVNPSDNYRKDLIALLSRFSNIMITNPSEI